MITGDFMINVTVEAKDQTDLERISTDVRTNCMKITGVANVEEVASDLSDDSSED